MEIPNEKVRISLQAQGDHTVVTFEGSIDEDTQYGSILKTQGALVFRLMGVKNINSLGIRNWVNFMRELGTRSVIFAECPPVLVRQMNMIPSFRGNAKVQSVLAPLVCDACEVEKMELVTSDHFADGSDRWSAPQACSQCQKKEMVFDGNPKQYFAFAK